MKHAIPDAVLEQHFAILGKTGRGKSTTAKVCVEQVYDQDYRVCVLDLIKSDWWGITSSADGRRPGLPFHILGGPHAHLPLASNSGKAIADLVARGQLRHTIIDMAEFEPGGQMKFFVDFAPRLMQRMKGVLYLVLEEAHLLAPKERAGMGYENMSVHWAKMLATAGRTKGIRLIILSQRTQAVHNAVLGSCDSMIVHGMTAPADMEPVTKWLKANNKDKALNAQIEGSLSGLPTGAAWLCSSEAHLFERVQIPKARTYDNTKTPTDDEELREVKTAPVDLEQLRALLGKAAAEAEASDPGVLRKRIAELEGQLAREKRVAPVTAEEIDGHRRQGFDLGYKSGFDEAQRQAELIVSSVAAEATSHAEHVIEALKYREVIVSTRAPLIKLSSLNSARVPGNPLMNKAQRQEFFTKMASDINTEHAVNFDTELEVRDTKGARAIPWTVTRETAEGEITIRENPSGLRLRILGALRWLEDKGIQPAARATVGALADCVPDKGYGARMIGELKTEGLVRIPKPGTLELTDEGRVLAPEPPKYASLFAAWSAITSGLQREVLIALKEAYPEAVPRETLAQVLGKTLDKGYGARVLGELKTMGAIHYPQRGTLQLTKHVMP